MTTPYWTSNCGRCEVYHGDALDTLRGLPDGLARCCVTSPPYWGLRDYGVDGQLGLEATPEAYIASMVAVFREVRRVLADDGTLWLNIGDSYAANRSYQVTDNKHTDVGNNAAMSVPPGLKPKDLVGIPWMLAFALRADGWYLRQDIIWHKPNPMPESVRDRCTKAHEYLFLLSKSGEARIWRARDTFEWSRSPDLSERLPAPTEDDPDATVARWRGFDYYYDAKAIQEPTESDRPDMAVKGIRTGLAYLQQGNGAAHNSVPKLARSGNKTRKPATERGCPNNGVDGNVPWEGSTRNRRSVWTVATAPYPEAHFATYPPALITPCILAGSAPGDTVLDPFTGSGTTGAVAAKHGRRFVGVELNPDYITLAAKRISGEANHLFAETAA